MRVFEVPDMKANVFVRALVAATFILLLQGPVTAYAEDKMITQETLLDRIRIEDLMTRYYVDLTSGAGHNLAEFFTEDAVLDINGREYKGHKAIQELYDELDGPGNGEGRFHMLMSNPVINVDGDTATIWIIWTGIMNDDISQQPRLLEQGREHTELVKRDGRWLIKHRSITADSGLPARWAETYKPRTYR